MAHVLTAQPHSAIDVPIKILLFAQCAAKDITWAQIPSAHNAQEIAWPARQPSTASPAAVDLFFLIHLSQQIPLVLLVNHHVPPAYKHPQHVWLVLGEPLSLVGHVSPTSITDFLSLWILQLPLSIKIILNSCWPLPLRLTPAMLTPLPSTASSMDQSLLTAMSPPMFPIAIPHSSASI